MLVSSYNYLMDNIPHMLTVEEYPHFVQYMREIVKRTNCELTVRMEGNNPFLKVPMTGSHIYVSVEDIFPALQEHHRILYEPCHHSALDAEFCSACQQTKPPKPHIAI